MVTTCKTCGKVIVVPPTTHSLRWLGCPNGHANLSFAGMLPSLVEPMRVRATRAFPWVAEFPPRY